MNDLKIGTQTNIEREMTENEYREEREKDLCYLIDLVSHICFS